MTYDKHAITYDKDNKIIEQMFSKSRDIFHVLRGKIIEVGVGTGNNLSYYHPSAKIVALDFSPKMIKLAKDKINVLGLINVEQIVEGDIQNLSYYFNPNSFDYVTSTCVFCSIPDPIKGLQEVKKVLKKNGVLLQIEHGVSNFSLINLLLKLLDPITVRWRGFHLSRNHEKNLEKAGFRILKQQKIDLFGIMRLLISKPI